MNATGKLIKLGLIGAGKWGQNYIRTIGRSNDARLVRLTSSNPEAGNLVGADCTISNDWRDLINDTDIDGLILAVPPTTQVQIALAALENKIPLLLEKPLATTVADAKRISDLAVKNNVPVLVDHIYLFHPAYEALKREAKKLEQIKSINSTGGDTGPFRADWNPLWDWGPHDVAMCLDLTGEYPSNISAKRDEVKTKHGVGEIFNAKLEFPSGITANISFGNG
ncbi:MAG: Gfo/Idh/MocA family oxidoreductase, partial [Rhodospirillaceae bacterium]|nr:Gfo/Idh/MocA family oxidoreductase [Rhodospirillaceae bacterium]